MQNETPSKAFVQEYKEELQKLCQVKVEEFALMGYESVTSEEIWKCVLSMKKGTHSLHEFVSTLITLKIGQFMNYETMNAFKGIF